MAKPAKRRRAVVVERAPKSFIQKWADEYELPSVRDVIDKTVADKIIKAMVVDFVGIVTDKLVDDLNITLGQPGELCMRVGWEESEFIPHTVEAKYTMKNFADDLVGEYATLDVGGLKSWRTHIALLLESVDKALAESND